MGIFNGNSKRESAEEFVLQALSQLPVIDDMILTMQHAAANEGQDWLLTCKSYYDNRIRNVTIGNDLFQIAWYGEDKKVAYSFTSSGYTPLHNHTNEKGREDVSLSKVRYLLASIIRDRMQEKFPDFNFNPVDENDNYASFSYTVPALKLKKWF